MTNSQLLQLGASHHQAGRLAEAEQAYQQVLASEPNQPDAMHLLGVLAGQVGKLDIAAELIGRAIRMQPMIAEYHSNAASIYRRMGQLERSEQSLRTALRLRPDLADAYNNLGITLRDMGKLDDAIAAYHRASELKPQSAEAANNLGNALQEKGDFAGAINAYQRAIALKPTQVQTWYNLGLSLHQAGRNDEAIPAYEHAIALKPDYAEAHNDLGVTLADLGKWAEAASAYDTAVKIKADFADAYNNLGNALSKLGQMDSAVAHFNRAIQLKPDLAEAYGNLGNVLLDQGKFDASLIAHQKAIALRPDSADANYNLGNIYRSLGRLDDALAAYEKAKELDPANPLPQSNLAYVILFHPACDAHAHLERAREFGRQWTFPTQPHKNARSMRRLKIGYVSANFNRHCQNLFTRPLFAHHDPEKVEIFCYSDVLVPDAFTADLRAKSHQWRDITNHTDQSVADQIRHDEIDVLVDLTLHMARNRLLVFARKPAPVQVTWLGYPGTTGLEAIDYRLTDPYLDPPGTDHLYTENSLRLPDTFWCYDPGPTPDVAPLPFLKDGFITFGSLNSSYAKVNPGILDLWEKILNRVPNSKLILLTPPGDHRPALSNRFGNRLTMVEYRPREKYLELYGQIDICLDTIPYNAHTTSLDAFYMGVPYVTLIGSTVVGRAGWSQLNNLRLTELAAKDPAEFVEIAAALAGNTDRLITLRSTLRDRMRQSPLMDAAKFARNIEDAYQTMWRAWISQ